MQLVVRLGRAGVECNGAKLYHYFT